MAEEPLTAGDIAAGGELVRFVCATEPDVAAAFWHYQSDSARWRLTIAIPSAGRDLMGLYMRVAAATLSLEIGKVAFVTPEEPIARAMAHLSRTTPERQGPVIGALIDGVYIDDAWIYALPARFPAAVPLTTT